MTGESDKDCFQKRRGIKNEKTESDAESRYLVANKDTLP